MHAGILWENSKSECVENGKNIKIVRRVPEKSIKSSIIPEITVKNILNERAESLIWEWTLENKIKI